jgi:hypothetical protein
LHPKRIKDTAHKKVLTKRRTPNPVEVYTIEESGFSGKGYIRVMASTITWPYLNFPASLN